MPDTWTEPSLCPHFSSARNTGYFVLFCSVCSH
jgi:hypothetical protein